MQGQHPIPQKVLTKTSHGGGEVCPNVFLLGSSGLLLKYSMIRLTH
jgi:hypothetical protein